MTIKSPLRYPGGKSRAISRILAKIPEQFREYREPFVGGGSVFLGIKASRHNTLFLQPDCYLINDILDDLACFWIACRDDLEALTTSILAYWQLYQGKGRELYNYLKSPDYDKSSVLQQAVRFFIMNRITFSGVMDAGGYSQQAFEKRFTLSSIERIRALHPYLKDVQVQCGDYESLVLQTGQDVFIFLDPPYYSATDSRLYGERGALHTGFDHERFAKVMQACPHQWLITYDDSPYIRDLFHFAQIESWELQYGMNNYKQKNAAKGQEIFIWNY